MKFKIPKKVLIISEYFSIKQDKSVNGGSFSFSTNTITVGTKLLESNPEYVFETLVHEISEVLHCKLEQRYEASGSEKDYLFSMDHKKFQIHNSTLSGVIYHQLLK